MLRPSLPSNLFIHVYLYGFPAELPAQADVLQGAMSDLYKRSHTIPHAVGVPPSFEPCSNHQWLGDLALRPGKLLHAVLSCRFNSGMEDPAARLSRSLESLRGEDVLALGMAIESHSSNTASLEGRMKSWSDSQSSIGVEGLGFLADNKLSDHEKLSRLKDLHPGSALAGTPMGIAFNEKAGQISNRISSSTQSDRLDATLASPTLEMPKFRRF